MHLTFPLLQPHTGCVGAAASKSAVEPQGLESRRDVVLLCRFHGTAEAPRLKPCCLPSPAQLAERINVLSQGYVVIAFFPSEPSQQIISIVFAFPPCH